MYDKTIPVFPIPMSPLKKKKKKAAIQGCTDQITFKPPCQSLKWTLMNFTLWEIYDIITCFSLLVKF